MHFFSSQKKSAKNISDKTTVMLSEPKLTFDNRLDAVKVDVAKEQEMLQNMRESFSKLFSTSLKITAQPNRSILKTTNSLRNYTPKKRLIFNPTVTIAETYSAVEYSRKGDYTAKSLTAEDAFFIKNELNSFKLEMEIHENSKHHTHMYQI